MKFLRNLTITEKLFFLVMLPLFVLSLIVGNRYAEVTLLVLIIYLSYRITKEESSY